ncbi:hypothetical protein [Ancylobacter sp. IITR112]|uniref:hypothetical protein n=1 Tax=Ancylobacter sp. IITR112 TaxID=3138073 RepID=UPI00352A999F
MADQGNTAGNPLNELNVQLPGRLMTLEILVTLLLREKAGSGRMLAQARQALSHIEAEILRTTPPGELDYPFAIFAAARAAVDKIAAEVG